MTIEPPQPGTMPPATKQPQQLTLPDSLMRAITLITGDRQTPPAAIVEAVILMTFGYALYRRQDTIDPAQVAIPTEQWNTICQALLDVPSRSGLTGINLVLDWVNVGPATQDEPTTHDDAQDDAQDESATGAGDAPLAVSVPGYAVADWQHAVADGRTQLGYRSWATRMRHLDDTVDARKGAR